MDNFFASLPTSGLFAGSMGRVLSRFLADGGSSVPGSTDGVVLMAVIIVLIIIIPVVLTRRRWMR
jgi:uncharacterized membrane-anchored protein